MIELHVHTPEEDEIEDVGAGITDDILEALDADVEDGEEEKETKEKDTDDEEEEVSDEEDEPEDVDYDTFDDVDNN